MSVPRFSGPSARGQKFLLLLAAAGRWLGAGLPVLGEQAYFVHTGRPHRVDRVHYGTVVGAGIGAEENHLVGLVLEQILYLGPEIGNAGLILPEKDLAVARDGDGDGVFL